MHTILYCTGLVVGFIFGDTNNALLYTLICFIFIDYLLGVSKAIHFKELSSNVGFRGIFKKVLMLVIVALAHILDVYVLHTGDALKVSCLFYYIANEGISIVENASVFIPVPKKIKEVLDQINEESGEDDGD